MRDDTGKTVDKAAPEHECDNCDAQWTEAELGNGNGPCGVDDLIDRIEPGCEVPSGQCPECGGLVYLINPPAYTCAAKAAAAPELLAALEDAVAWLDKGSDPRYQWPTWPAAARAAIAKARFPRLPS